MNLRSLPDWSGDYIHKHYSVVCNISARLSSYLVDNQAILVGYPSRCNTSTELSRYFADNRANLADYSKKLTRPVVVGLATS